MNSASFLTSPYSPSRDYPQVMKFLRNSFLKSKSYLNWLPDRFENSHLSHREGHRLWTINYSKESKTIALPQLVAIVIQESPLAFDPQISPEFVDTEFGITLEENMIAYIELYAKKQRKEKSLLRLSDSITIHSLEGNNSRVELLKAYGYHQEKTQEYFRVFTGEFPNVPLNSPPEFRIRSVNPPILHSKSPFKDFQKIAQKTRKIFGHGEWFTYEVLKQVAQSSFYHRDLDLVAETESGEIAAFLTFRLDPISKIANIEPLATDAKFRGRKLAQSLISEGLFRLKKYNPSLVCVGGAANNPAANALYNRMGFTQKRAIEVWKKKLQK